MTSQVRNLRCRSIDVLKEGDKGMNCSCTFLADCLERDRNIYALKSKSNQNQPAFFRDKTISPDLPDNF